MLTEVVAFLCRADSDIFANAPGSPRLKDGLRKSHLGFAEVCRPVLVRAEAAGAFEKVSVSMMIELVRPDRHPIFRRPSDTDRSVLQNHILASETKSLTNPKVASPQPSRRIAE